MQKHLWVVALALAGCLGQTTAGTGGGTGDTTGDSSATAGSDTGTSGSTGSATTSGTTGSGTTGTFGPALDGLSVDRLHFALLGDCRPSTYVNDASQVAGQYPSSIIANIFQHIGSRGAQFALFSGDILYTHNAPDGSAAEAQIQAFLSAWNDYGGPFAPALGNHEEDDASAKRAWLGHFGGLAYYAFTVHTSQGDARFIVADDTFWDSRQLSWIQTELASSARYHIVLKHQASTSTDNDETQFKQIIQANRPSLIIAGHAHTYFTVSTNQIVLGTAGATLANGAPGYGYGMVDQLADGRLQVSVFGNSDAQIDQWIAQ